MIDGPQPVTARRDARAFAPPADASLRGSHAPIPVTIRLVTASELPATAGVATVTKDGVQLQWVPFTTMPVAEDGSRQMTWNGEVQGGSITIATSPDDARHAYLLRVQHGTESAMHIECAVATVALRPPEGVSTVGPLRLVRVDRPDWLPRSLATAGLVVDAETSLLLGPGDYELVDPIDPTRRQRFAAPAAAAITIDASLAAPRVAQR